MRLLKHQDLESVLKKGDSARRDTQDIDPPRFKPGEAVRTRNMHPLGHTRLPRYARAKHGVIALCHGVFVFPDTHAASGNPKPQYCYAVRFTMRELWGDQASERDSVTMDLFDDYLEPAGP